MAVAGALTYEAVFDDKGMLQGFRNIEKEGKKLDNSMSVAFGNILSDIAKVGADALKSITKAGIDYNSQMENYQTSFKVMLGSAEEATTLLEQLQEMGAKTPFELSDLASATESLIAFGESNKTVLPIMEKLGDISLGNKEKFDSLVLAYGKMNSSQKVTLENLNIMIDRGFNPLSIIAEKTGESMGDLYERVSTGKVSFNEVKAAIDSATSAGGQFYEGMKQQSSTFAGQISTLKDNLNIFLGEALKPLFDFLKDSVLPLLNDFLSGGDKVNNWLQKNKDFLILSTIAIGTLTTAIIAFTIQQNLATIAIKLSTIATTIATGATAAFGTAIAFLTSPITLIIVAIGALIAILYVLVKNWDTVKANAISAFQIIKATISLRINEIINSFNILKAKVIVTFLNIKETVVTTFENVKSKISSTINNMINTVKSGIDKIKSFFNFSWSLPKIKLPHFTATGKFSLDPPSIPKFGVNWYAKGGYMKKPSIFGASGNSLNIGGEAGAEVALPLEKNTEWMNKFYDLFMSRAKQDKLYNSNSNIANSYNNINSKIDGNINITLPTYLDGNVLYESNQKIALRKALGGA